VNLANYLILNHDPLRPSDSVVLASRRGKGTLAGIASRPGATKCRIAAELDLIPSRLAQASTAFLISSGSRMAKTSAVFFSIRGRPDFLFAAMKRRRYPGPSPARSWGYLTSITAHDPARTRRRKQHRRMRAIDSVM
jgi:hypothetical protein